MVSNFTERNQRGNIWRSRPRRKVSACRDAGQRCAWRRRPESIVPCRGSSSVSGDQFRFRSAAAVRPPLCGGGRARGGGGGQFTRRAGINQRVFAPTKPRPPTVAEIVLHAGYRTNRCSLSQVNRNITATHGLPFLICKRLYCSTGRECNRQLLARLPAPWNIPDRNGHHNSSLMNRHRF